MSVFHPMRGVAGLELAGNLTRVRCPAPGTLTWTRRPDCSPAPGEEECANGAHLGGMGEGARAHRTDRDRLLGTFLDLAVIGSPTGHEDEIEKDLGARFGELGGAFSRDDIGTVVAVRPGTRDGTILLSTHMDTAGADRGIITIIGHDGVTRTDGSTILGADDKSGICRLPGAPAPAERLSGMGRSHDRVPRHGRWSRRRSRPAASTPRRERRPRSRSRRWCPLRHSSSSDGSGIVTSVSSVSRPAQLA